MSWIILVLVVVAILVAHCVLQMQRSRTHSNHSGSEARENLPLKNLTSDEIWPFYARKTLSRPEQVLYFRLTKVLPDHIVLAQVHFSRLLGVKKGSNYQAWSNRINRLSADFVVCNKDSSVVAVIELDDASHGREDHKATDAKKDKALSSAGVRIVRWQAKALPDEATIKESFLSGNKWNMPQAVHSV